MNENQTRLSKEEVSRLIDEITLKNMDESLALAKEYCDKGYDWLELHRLEEYLEKEKAIVKKGHKKCICLLINNGYESV